MSEKQEYIAKVDAAIESNYHNDDFGVHNLAQILGVSRSQLHRKIKAASGISASAYINEFRLKKAHLLLHQGSLTASEVAYAVGFGSPSYFSTAFKKYYSYSPGQVSIKKTGSLTTENPDGDTNGGHQLSERINYKASNKKILQRVLMFSLSIIGLAIVSYFILKESDLNANREVKTAIRDKSIAVLPFRNYSDDESMDAFCFGVTDELISKLSKITDFDRVISRTSSFKFQDMHLSIPEIASELGVAYILEGNVQQVEGEIRVSLQLIDARNDDHIWTDYYLGNWESKDILNIQEKVTAFVANALQIVVQQNSAEPINESIGLNKEAYDLFVRAKFHNFSSDEVSMDRAKQLLEKSISLDSAFAPALSELGLIWSLSGLSEGINNQDEAWEKGKYYLNRAQDLDPTLINNELYLLQGYFFYEWDFKRLEEFCRTKLLKYTYDRNSIGLVDYAIKTGRFEAALSAINKSIEVDPLDAVLFSFKARILWLLGKKEESMAILRQMDELNENDWLYLRESAHNYFMMKEYQHSKRALDILNDQFGDRSPLIIWLELNYAFLDKNEARVNSMYNELRSAYDNGDSGSPAWFIALYQLVIKNDSDKTFEWLEKSYTRKEVELTWFRQEPLLEPIRNDNRYSSLYQRIGFDDLISH